MKNRFILLLLLFLACNENDGQKNREGFLESNEKDYNSRVKESVNDIVYLETDLSYYYFTSSDSYLGWYEGYTKQIYTQDLKSGEIYNIPYMEGRGPFEILYIRGLEIIEKTMFVLDKRNNKVLEYDLESKQFIDEFLIEKNALTSIASSENKLFGKGRGKKGVFFEVDYKSNTLIELEDSYNSEVFTSYMKNPGKYDGEFLANSNSILNIRYYETSIYLYNGNSMEDFFYDDTEMKTVYPKKDFGFYDLPDVVSMNLQCAAFKPNTNIIYIVGEGVTNRLGELDTGTIYEYDLEARDYVGEIKTKAEVIADITVTKDAIYVYDQKDFTIKRVEL